MGEIPVQHQSFVIREATGHFAGRRASVRKRVSPKYDLAILHNPSEVQPPSDAKALRTLLDDPERAYSSGLDGIVAGSPR